MVRQGRPGPQKICSHPMRDLFAWRVRISSCRHGHARKREPVTFVKGLGPWRVCSQQAAARMLACREVGPGVVVGAAPKQDLAYK
jgi:hypothetical protein